MTGYLSSLASLEKCDGTIIEELFEEYYIPLTFFAQNYIPDENIAKDMVQNAFLALIESSPKFHHIDNFKAYLYQSVKNECLQYLRHQKVKKRYEITICNETEEGETYLEYVLEEEIYSFLMKEINALPFQCRKVYLLTLEGKSYQEIADIMSIGVESVKTYKKTGKRILYERLKGIVSSQLITLLTAIST